MFCELCAAAIIGFLCWNLLQDSDYVLRFYEAFGKSDENLRGKVAWITGAGSGIGKALALHWASKSVRLVLTDLNSDSLEKVKSTIGAMKSPHTGIEDVLLLCTGPRNPFVKSTIGAMKSPHTGIEDVLLLSGDVTVRENHSKWFNSVMNKFGTLDILVNNAGRVVQGDFSTVAFDIDEALMNVNTMAPVGLTKEVLPHFIKKKSGHIVTTSSILGHLVIPNVSAYCASKAAVLLTGDFPKILNPMGPRRCAKLITVAVVNQVSEAWISTQPLLGILRISMIIPAWIFDWCGRMGFKLSVWAKKKGII
ncbi:unnamed protein product [Notodromas monacha]|uniref:Uncharacterized protein n=1 Tax=Notodromas monacha TaxID=399045 RepID=A0A7R9GJ73_9CRUS|nr:unnamed protein product [Notodromas monacha]CAG0922567.1 unnamed protein product [Notodromas monacha]